MSFPTTTHSHTFPSLPSHCVYAYTKLTIAFFLSVGGGPGSWSAWKAGEMARRYEARGGDYEDTGYNKNKAKKGEPEKK
jgi:hypothetical protein